ncbi:MAG: YggS family pyridoxal phosphate-dependent enzyme [Acidobacteriota bacterium]|nr:YggS family pyridoxal phosphate-dependent enzyme [Acidobacteriota bacterium]MDQ7087807.1 YggS family pyridoxal phosphate-dependent enzyme [Acidobacteriota bacterium]
MNTSARVGEVLEKIDRAARRAGRDPAEIELIAVSKTHSVEQIDAVRAAGVQSFGENRIQEALAKIARRPDLRWHFIGRLQRNKARRAVEHFVLIHSVDSLRLGEALDRIGGETGRVVEVLVEVNLGAEASKGGVCLDRLEDLVRGLARFEHLELRGLMTVPPPASDPEETRPFFRRLAEERRRLRALGLPRAGFEHLSMGMSADFEVAIEEGATMVRIGSALFGPRGRVSP